MKMRKNSPYSLSSWIEVYNKAEEEPGYDVLKFLHVVR